MSGYRERIQLSNFFENVREHIGSRTSHGLDERDVCAKHLVFPSLTAQLLDRFHNLVYACRGERKSTRRRSSARSSFR